MGNNLPDEIYAYVTNAGFKTWVEPKGEYKVTSKCIGRRYYARALSGQARERSCTCNPDDNPPVPCAQKYALSECKPGDINGELLAALKTARFVMAQIDSIDPASSGMKEIDAVIANAEKASNDGRRG